MSLHFAICRYRLLFKRPFGTAHGTRDGTDALFIHLEEDGVHGYGEATLPPYVKETVADVVDHVGRIAAAGPWSAEELLSELNAPAWAHDRNACRAALHMAVLDLIGQRSHRTVADLLGAARPGRSATLMTMGICGLEELPARIRELPRSEALKIKVGDPEALLRIKTILGLDDRKLFIDGNQGYSTTGPVLELVQAAADRLLGLEQPFPSEQDVLNADLARDRPITVFGDESIQNSVDLERKAPLFGGVNLKLMKGGGLDRAKAMAEQARALGLSVMLGSMSESSLGCTAMAHLAGMADIVDLDGPWLIKNDPFEGLGMEQGRIKMPDGPGLGVRLSVDLPFDHIGA